MHRDLIQLENNIAVALDQRKKLLKADLYATAAEELTALVYIPEEGPKWDQDFGTVGAILVGENGEYLAGADPREETTALRK